MNIFNFTQRIIHEHIINGLTPRQKVALELYKADITEEDFLGMKSLYIEEPDRIGIANNLRDLWKFGEDRWRKMKN